MMVNILISVVLMSKVLQCEPNHSLFNQLAKVNEIAERFSCEKLLKIKA